MGEGERREFLAWYESQEPIFNNRRVLENYCHDDVTVSDMRVVSFAGEFMEIVNIEIFIVSIKIASVCIKVLP